MSALAAARHARVWSAIGTFRTSRHVRPEFAFRCKAEDIGSHRVFRLLAQIGHWPTERQATLLRRTPPLHVGPAGFGVSKSAHI